MKTIKKPKLGSHIFYYNADGCLSIEVVMWKGKDSFICQNQVSDYFVEAFRCPIEYTEYGTRWFTSMRAAKKYIKAQFPDKKLIFTPCMSGPAWNVEVEDND